MGNVYGKIHNDDYLKELYDEMHKKIEDQKKFILQNDKEISTLKDTLEQKQEQIESLNNDLVYVQKLYNDVNDANHILQQEIQKNVAELKKKNNDINNYKASMDNYKASMDNYKASMDQYKTLINDLNSLHLNTFNTSKQMLDKYGYIDYEF